MNRLLTFSFALLLTFSFGWSQENVDFQEKDKPKMAAEKTSRVFTGGGMGLSLGSYTRISIEPLIGYQVSPKLSVALKFRYEYFKDTRYRTTFEGSNYGASIWGRYFVIPQLYAHAEYAFMKYDFSLTDEWIPFMLVGAGYQKKISKNTWVYGQVLFDVLQDQYSPYSSGEPFYSVGISVGI